MLKALIMTFIGVTVALPAFAANTEEKKTEQDLQAPRTETEPMVRPRTTPGVQDRHERDEAWQDRDGAQQLGRVGGTARTKVSDILGSRVVDEQGEQVGQISDLIIDPAQGQVAEAVISFGGFLGMGERSFTVSFDELEADPNQERYTLSGTKEELRDNSQSQRGRQRDQDNNREQRQTPDREGEGIFDSNRETEGQQRGY